MVSYSFVEDMVKKFFLSFLVLILVTGAAATGWLYYLVVVEPGEEIKAENIRLLLGKESSVYYSDGVHKLGVFFDTAHRQYVSYDDIPKNFINALVASEDSRFFEHFGFDLPGIFRAMIKNIQAGRVVQGGSTLTQQTAKNLFKRTERSYRAKLTELLYALRLEYYYPKEKIFEFYANQFYVSGNGHGLGVAARYYFNKKPEELSLLECAFIAGSVKRPNYYNPFRRKTEKGVGLAKSRAKVRLRYVLGKMLDLGMIDRQTYDSNVAQDLEFDNGRIGFALDHSMELVRDAVSSLPVQRALEAHDIANVATSGVKIITTLDKDLQDITQSSLRSALALLDVHLKGYDRNEVQREMEDIEYTGDSTLKEGAFLFGTVSEIAGTGRDIKIRVVLDKQLGEGLIEARGLDSVVGAWVKYEKNRWSQAGPKDLDRFVKKIAVGDRIWVSAGPLDEVQEGRPIPLRLEKYPEIQGGALVVRKGKIISMAGGNDNRFFNRAIQAKRAMGSAFKPLVFSAALQLGWNSADLLMNRREVFVYHGKPYFPRPDHSNPNEWVSMNWAGVKSENLASVWLVAKLCDKLTPLQFQEVAEKVGLAPKIVDGETEPYRNYRKRIRDEFGIQVNREILRRAAFSLAVKNLETDFLFEGLEQEYNSIKWMHYGLDFDRYQEQLDQELGLAKQPVADRVRHEYLVRSRLLQNNYLELEKRKAKLDDIKNRLENLPGSTEDLPLTGGTPYATAAIDIGVQEHLGFYKSQSQQLFYFLPDTSRITGVLPVGQGELLQYLRTLDNTQRVQFWQNIVLAEGVKKKALDMVAAQLDHEYEKLMEKLPFEFDVLAAVDDFRITVGLYYLIELCKEIGMESKLEPVLSFPLGSNVVSLFEATRLYESLATGKVTVSASRENMDDDEVFDEEIQDDSLAIIDRIETADGEVLYRPEIETRTVFDEKTSLVLGSILENTVRFGTGRYAWKNVKIAASEENYNLSLPMLGKTGTANNYVNASFFGYVPEVAPKGAAMTLDDGYAVGVYVGFDDNKPMRRRTTRITGAAGALPPWTDVVNGIVRAKQYPERLDPVDISFYGLGIERKKLAQLNVAVSDENGGVPLYPVRMVESLDTGVPSILTFGEITRGGNLTLERQFSPYWRAAVQKPTK